MKKKLFVGFIFTQILLLIALSLFPSGVAAASATSTQEWNNGVHCVNHKRIKNFNNEAQLQAKGFFINVSGTGYLSFEKEDDYKYLSLNVDTDFSGQPVNSRITEIDTSLPPEQRIKCWQPTAHKDVVVEYTVRFDQPNVPPGLTENLLLWNASLGVNSPMTAVGVTRNNIFNGYFAVIAQNLDFKTFPAPGSGHLQLVPMPVDPTDWHHIRVTLSETGASIEVAQGDQPYTTVLQASGLQPFEPLGFEFSVDNEVAPGLRVPITVPDALDVGHFDIRLK